DEDLALLDLKGLKGEVEEEAIAKEARLVPVRFYRSELPLGRFLTAPQPSGKPGAFGVVSVKERNLRETDQAHLGIMADEKYRGEGVRIANVQPEYGAAEAGLQPGDVILKVDDRIISGLQELKNALSSKQPGDKVTISVDSAGKEKPVEVILSNRPVLGQFSGDRLNQMEIMGGDTNEVRDGFSRVVQTDMTINSDQIGGPVVDLQGRVVGITLARADRTRTYVMGSAAVMDLLKQEYDSVADAKSKSALKKQQLAKQQREMLPKMRAAGKPQDIDRMKKHLSDMERLMGRMKAEMDALEER
ncbi:MAG: PDZ domain-containing protein, partial [Armatimonadetes bacterium]|nr:PDZ domain-containing protein [Akkermansiaceae bacterium]